MNKIWKPSPNHSIRKRKIDLIVIHSTASDFISALSWLTSTDSKVSAHYLIDKNGDLYYLVLDAFKAWHAGNSFWKGLQDVNDNSIGIELVNLNDGKDDYTLHQYSVCAELAANLMKTFKILDIAGHKDIAPGRKNDPFGFDWVKFNSLVWDNLAKLVQSTH